MQGDLNVWYIVYKRKNSIGSSVICYELLKRFQYEFCMMELGSLGDDGTSTRIENQLQSFFYDDLFE